MRLGIKGKQVLGVTSIVGVVVVALSAMHLAELARVKLRETEARADLVSSAIYHRAREVVVRGADAAAALRADPGLRSILESSLFSNNVTSASIVDVEGFSVVHADPAQEGRLVPVSGTLDDLIARPPLSLLLALYSSDGQPLSVVQPLLIGDAEFGSIRIAVSPLLIRGELNDSLSPAVASALLALGVAVLAAMLLAQLMLRPIHVIQSGLTRLGRGEFGVRLDLNQQDEFGELGTFFNTVSAQLSADRSQMAEQVAHLESAVDHLEDALAIVSPAGELIFVNPAMRALVPAAGPGVKLVKVVPADHPFSRACDQALVSRQSRGPVPVSFDSGERLVLAHPITTPKGDLVGIMMIVRNLEYLSQVQSTIRYSRKLAALGRLSAGVAHEVKNPLNAMMIHLELLRLQLSPRAAVVGRAAHAAAVRVSDADAPSSEPEQALEHVDVIAQEIRRLDEVVQGFLKFTRAEDLKLQPVHLATLFDEVIPIVRLEADRHGVQLVVAADGAPEVNGDPAMLRQAFLNLAINACQAMPDGGTLTIRCEPARGRRVVVTFEDTGVGIAPEHLKRIFDLYFTTKAQGSGIGLSMVYRTVQMHDGEIEVQSTPGKGTTFRLELPRA
jgi:signal transduction histidine kinase